MDWVYFLLPLALSQWLLFFFLAAVLIDYFIRKLFSLKPTLSTTRRLFFIGLLGFIPFYLLSILYVVLTYGYYENLYNTLSSVNSKELLLRINGTIRVVLISLPLSLSWIQPIYSLKDNKNPLLVKFTVVLLSLILLVIFLVISNFSLLTITQCDFSGTCL